MSNTDRAVTSLRREQAELAAALSRTQAQLRQARQTADAEHRQALEVLRADTLRQVDAQGTPVRTAGYLEQTVSAQEAALEAEYRRIQAQYEQISQELHTALAQEQRAAEALLLREQEFERAYFARLQFARQEAENTRRTAGELMRQTAADLPIDWFFPGHLDLYSTRLRELEHRMEDGFYESVIGISENLILSLRLDALETETQLRRFLHSFEVLRGLLGTLRELLFVKAPAVPDTLPRFAQSRDIRDGRMGRETLDYWSDGAYSALTDAYEEIRRTLLPFEQNGTLGMEEAALCRFMTAHPEQAAAFPAEQIYRLSLSLTEQLDETQSVICRMRQRMQAFEERMQLTEAVRTALRAENYPIHGTQLLGKPGDPIRISFCDTLRTTAFELLLFPVLRRADRIWVNQAVCCLPEQCSQKRQEELHRILGDVLTGFGIEAAFRTMPDAQPAQDRAALAMTERELKINGRLH